MAFWTRALDLGLADRAEIVVRFSESPEHIAQMAVPGPSQPASVPIPPDSPNIMIGTQLGDRIDAMPERGTTIYGMEGDDQLHGGNGNDTFIGGPGADSMYGGPGADVFRFEALQHMDGDFVMPGGSDDVLDFRKLGATYRGAEAFVPNGAPQLRYEVQFHPSTGRPGTQYLQADANGDRAVDYALIHGGAVSHDNVLV